jgi:hypothetical protein
MAKMKVGILSVTVACLLATAAWADEPQASAATEPSSTLVGERVRLSGPSPATHGEPLIGQVVAVDLEAITVVKDKRTGESIRIPFSSIQRLDIARAAQRSKAGEGLLIGIAIPAALGGVALAAEHCSGGDDTFCHLGSAIVFAVGVPVGALTGAIVGGLSHDSYTRWERVDTRRRVRVSVLPDLRGGVRGGLSVRF